MRKLITPLFFFLAFFSIGKAQVVDSIVVNADISCKGKYADNFLNIGEDGFLLFGTKPNHGKGVSYFSKTFEIQHYDSSLKCTVKKFELDARALYPTVYYRENIAYFLIPAELQKVAYLIIYNTKTDDGKTIKLENNWKRATNFELIATDRFIYIKHDDQSNDGRGNLISQPRIEFADFTSLNPQLTEISLTGSNNELPVDAGIIYTINQSDSVFFELNFQTNNPGEINKKKSNLIRGFFDGKLIIEGQIQNSSFHFLKSYLVSNESGLAFISLAYGSDSLFSYSESFKENEFIHSKIYLSVWEDPIRLNADQPIIFHYTDESIISHHGTIFSAYQNINFSDYTSRNFDTPLLINGINKTGMLIDTSLVPFEAGEKTILPSNYMVNLIPSGADLFIICSSWQVIKCYKLDINNKLSFVYTLHTSIHQELNKKSPDMSIKTMAGYRNREEILNSIRIEPLCSRDYIVYSITPAEENKGLTLRLYKCRI